MRLRSVVTAIIAVTFLAACSPGVPSSNGTPADKQTVGSDGGRQNAPTDTGQASVDLVASGFGQSDAYVQGIAIVTTRSKASVGRFVTVSANFLDKSGAIIGTEEQVESFSWVGQQLVLPIWLDLSDKRSAKVAKIDPRVSISDYGDDASAKPALPILKSTQVKKVRFQGTTASFAFKNDSDTDLKHLRVGVVCYKGGRIIGGKSTYPDLAPAHQTIRIDTDVVTTGKPKTCKAFLNYGDF